MQEPTTRDPIITLKAEIGLEEVAAIKVAEVEHDLLVEKEQASLDLTTVEKEINEISPKVKDAVFADTLENYPEIKAIEKMLKGQFPKHFGLSIELIGDDRVRVGVEAGGELPLRGENARELLKKIRVKQVLVSKIEGILVDVRKKLGQLPYLERATRAAVAKARLEGSKEGREVLKRISAVCLPGLPAPKKG